MRRLVSLAVLLLFAIPFGVSVSGCSKKTVVTYCDGNDSGPVIGQVTTIDLEPRLTGISLNESQIGSVSGATAKDCKSSSVSVTAFTYGSSNLNLVDIEPTNGRLCAGVWNRNTGGGVPDFTTCTGNGGSGIATITASAQGAVSNSIPVFVHPVVTSIVLGAPSVNCTTDPASNCINTNVAATCITGVPTAVAAYTGNACFSQGSAGQLTARTYQGTDITNPANNISCQVGPLTFSAQNTAVVTIDPNGLATAQAPGSTIINANISNSSSTAGFFATCPPASIVLTPAGSTTVPTAPITVAQNIQQDLVATVTDTNGVKINNVALEYESTTPITVPVAGGIVTPTYNGAASVTAVCQPPTCNSSPIQQIGLFGNGSAVTSNPVRINATGTGNSTVLYVASTNSQFIQAYDFTAALQNAPVRLPYAPNSLVLSTDLSTIYMGTPNEIMTFSTATNQLLKEDTTISGTVISVSPDSGTAVITDPVRKLVYLYTSAGAISTEYGGVATRAQWTPDSQTVYITTNDSRLLVYSTFNGWTAKNISPVASDVAITIPQQGAYLAGATTEAVSACPVGTVSGAVGSQIVTNTYYPQSDADAATTDLLTATTDGKHMIGATSAATPRLTDFTITLPSTTTTAGQVVPAACPQPGASAQVFTHSTKSLAFTTAVPTAITGVIPTTDSTYALFTYTGTGAVVPQYVPGTSTLTNIALQKTTAVAPIAPVAGVISTDNQTAYIGTTGDNLVHQLTRNTTGFSDTVAPLNPALPAITGSGIATPNLLVQRPRKATS
ncbi:hypothetical protein [Granulicella tundricola]|uniref:Putative lipoprotein n=1 Tax=Granulicella tundricola (strain ATCC BAA-1859 / DSM 23138 / MP5ACTX9) TaxID=1198114 RepID=E8WZL2_GRATM|nr:hypothetical protein [Granulicella tundricola]ADW69986.1 putative lipoprotein [Granulicella tundricola MP5ACTX9]